MANIKSQIKRNRQNEGRRLRNKAIRSRLKTEVKKAQAGGEDQPTADQVRATSRLLDKAVSKGVLHKRTAARRKSKLARQAAAGSQG